MLEPNYYYSLLKREAIYFTINTRDDNPTDVNAHTIYLASHYTMCSLQRSFHSIILPDDWYNDTFRLRSAYTAYVCVCAVIFCNARKVHVGNCIALNNPSRRLLADVISRDKFASFN